MERRGSWKKEEGTLIRVFVSCRHNMGVLAIVELHFTHQNSSKSPPRTARATVNQTPDIPLSPIIASLSP